MRDGKPGVGGGSTPSRWGSILYPDSGLRPEEGLDPPDFFHDLNLDQVVELITRGRQDYNLKPLFYTRPKDVRTVQYRQDVMRDVERDRIAHGLHAWAGKFRTMHRHLAAFAKIRHEPQKQRWFLEAVKIYCEALEQLRQDFEQTRPSSRGLCSFEAYLRAYLASDAFQTLRAQCLRLTGQLSAIRYTMHLHDGCVTVCKTKEASDYSAVVSQTFARFKTQDAAEIPISMPDMGGMTELEEKVLDFVVRLFPEEFRELRAFCDRHVRFLDSAIVEFDRDIQFYLAFLEFRAGFSREGLTFCYPKVSDTSKSVRCRDGFDLAMAAVCLAQKGTVVRNDFDLGGEERILVVTGPNQGGKTTFARMFGQLHYLGSLGCPVPAAEAELFFFDRLFVHFERGEDPTLLRGKLQDELIRIRGILAAATPSSMIILNEMFSSTMVTDAEFLGREILGRIAELDVLAICVTFLDELASLNRKTVSMVAAVDAQDPARRTYRIERRPADGLAYSQSLAKKHGLTYETLGKRLTRS